MALYIQYLIKYKVERSNMLKAQEEEKKKKLKEEEEREMSKPGVLRFAEQLRRENERNHESISGNDDLSGLDLLHYLRNQRMKVFKKEKELKQKIEVVERKLPTSLTKAQKVSLIKEKLNLEDLGTYEEDVEGDPLLESLLCTSLSQYLNTVGSQN